MILGFAQWFAFEDRKSVEQAVLRLGELRAAELRTLFSWADWCREGGPEWFDHFIGALARVPHLRLLPTLCYTPMQFARKDARGETRTNYPPQDLSAYPAFVTTMIERYGKHFDSVQIWNEPNWDPYWSWEADPTGELFARMACMAADAAHALGKKVALGGTTPLDHPWFTRMFELQAIQKYDAVAFHYSPSWPDAHRRWQPLPTEIHTLRTLLKGFTLNPEVWITEIGFSTNTKTEQDAEKLEQAQITYFDYVKTLPVERAYWFSLFDQAEEIPTDDETNSGRKRDPTAYHFGMIRVDGVAKPLFEHIKNRAP